MGSAGQTTNAWKYINAINFTLSFWVILRSMRGGEKLTARNGCIRCRAVLLKMSIRNVILYVTVGYSQILLQSNHTTVGPRIYICVQIYLSKCKKFVNDLFQYEIITFLNLSFKYWDNKLTSCNRLILTTLLSYCTRNILYHRHKNNT